MRGSLYNYIANNTIYSNGNYGIRLGRSWSGEPVVWGSSHNTITFNVIYLNDDGGIKLKNSSNNIITNNIVYANEDIGICAKNSSDNQIYHNNLIYNDEQASDDSSNNSWDMGSVIGGNYWSDHECTGNPSNGSQPYYIDSDSIDHYPFGDPIGELPPLPPPVPRTDVDVFKTEWLYTSETYIDHNQTYNFDIGWDVDIGDVQNLDNVTITISTPIDITYTGTSTFYTGTWESYNCSFLPFNHIGENYTWVLPLKEGFTTCIDFQLPEEKVQSNPWADMVVNTMDEDGYTRVNITIIPITPSVSGGPSIRGKVIDSSYPPEFEVDVFFPDYLIDFHGDWEDLNQNQSYNFSVLVDNPKDVELWLDKTQGQWDTEYSNTVTLPVSELGSVTVS
ncbi:copper-binding protein (NosD) [Candidatus Methanophagaceae archaeon]|nr:copper-binding protein (NosD) [Methanophagales archaeon]